MSSNSSKKSKAFGTPIQSITLSTNLNKVSHKKNPLTLYKASRLLSNFITFVLLSIPMNMQLKFLLFA